MSAGTTRQNPMLIDDDDWPDMPSQNTNTNNTNNNNNPAEPQSHPYNFSLPLPPTATQRHSTRETRSAALSILSDLDALTLQALAYNETIPQTRRRIQARFLAPEDKEDQKVLRGERFIIQVGDGEGEGGSSGNGNRKTKGGDETRTPLCVVRDVVDVHDEGEEGWIGPGSGYGGASGSGFGSRSASASASASPSGSSTPEKRTARRRSGRD